MKSVALSSLSSFISSLYDSIEKIHFILKTFCSVKNIDNYMEFVMKVLKDVFIFILCFYINIAVSRMSYCCI